MQIQRIIEESTSVCGEVRGHPKVVSTMRDADSTARKIVAADSEANGSFLHGTETTTTTKPNIEKSVGEKIVYATIDRLALKRTRLPLQLVPIDDDDDDADVDAVAAVEKKERTSSGDKRINGSRKTSPRRPSFKVRPGGVPTSSVQWKSRAAATAAAVRPNPRVNRIIGKFESSATMDLASRLAMFENIIRNGDAAAPTFARRGVIVTNQQQQQKQQQPSLDHHQEVPETVTSRDKHSGVIHPSSSRNSSASEEIADAASSDDSPREKKERREAATKGTNESKVSAEDSGNGDDVDDDDDDDDSGVVIRMTDGPSKRNEEYFESVVKKKSSVDATEKSSVDATKKSSVDATKTSSVDATKKSSVEAMKKSSVDATKKSSVDAMKKSSVDATKKSSVDATKKSSVDATKKSSVDATKKSSVDTTKKSSIDATKKSSVDATKKSSVDTTKKSSIDATEKSSIDSTKKSSVATTKKSFVAATKKSFVATTKKSSVDATKKILETGRSVSREDLRHSISLPTNFVHLASGDSRLIRDFENGVGGSSSSLTVIMHEEKCATLRYLGNNNNNNNNNGDEVVAKVAAGKIVRKNSRGKTERRSLGNFTETGLSGGGGGGVDDETYGCSTTTTTTKTRTRTSSSLSLLSDDNVNRAKVTALENSQGAPEVVKRSENEGSSSSSKRENAERKTEQVEVEEEEEEEEHLDAPVYEAMSEFSISTYDACSPAAVAAADDDADDDDDADADAASRANSSFLWGGRAPRILETGTMSCGTVDENAPSGRGDDDNSLAENDRDAYDDVGLSRDDTEEDHYDDVGLPWTKNSSTDTLFEEIGDGVTDLYDDVLPGPIAENSKATKITSVNCSDLPAIKSAAAEISESTAFPLRKRPSSLSLENADQESNAYSSVEDEGLNDFEGEEDDGLYDDVELPSQERVNSLYAGSSSGSQLGSLYNGKESEWEDLDEAVTTAQPSLLLLLPKKINVALRNGDAQAAPSKKKSVQRWSRKVRRQKSKASRKNSAMRAAASRGGTSTFSDTASDDSNYETLFSYPSDEFSSSDDEDSPRYPSSPMSDDPGLRVNGMSHQEAPSRPVPPPPRESSLTESFGKRMKMLRRTWSITKGSLGRMRRRTSTVDASLDDGVKYANGEQQQQQHHQISNGTNDGKKYFSFKKHFKKTGLSTFYLENENAEDRLSRNNNCSKEEVYSDGSNNSWYTNTDYWKTGVVEQSRRNEADHYSMLDEEPLYQFYAAAAARVAFESDSEGYEEVEDPTPTPSAVDLAKPGHRTLWCQTPQVIGSALLQRLTSDEKKMQEAKFEIFTSEASYLNSLRVLVDEFLNDHELVHEILTPSERDKLFGGVPSVLLASERLLAELETVWREDVMFRGLPEVLLNYAQRSSSVYVAYCSNQVSIDTTLKELRSKKGSKFVETVRRIESHPACQSLSLHSFLMLPMQRVTRLPLLADAVLSKVSSDNKDERTCWECVLSQLSQVVMECNEGARAAGRLAEMEALERILEYSSKVPPIVLRDRYLVRRGPVVQMLAKSDAEYKLTFGKKHHKASLYLLLLTDYLLVAKPKLNANEETYTVIDTCKRSLVALEKVTEDSPFAGRHAMVLTLLENHSQRHVEYILTCKNATERERWLDAISPPKPSLVGETLYETWDCPQVMALYPYAAAQPDELTLQPGDVINVLRKMTDGWHLGEKLLGGEQGWFPGNYAKEVASEHVRARNLRQRHRLLALSASVLQQRAKLTAR